ncbi:hypothetical protein G9A89_017769 [Geosiphon pyriformis]|nr:hypothetical protein G9A89_017769 [Geosiphon pyriformis]
MTIHTNKQVLSYVRLLKSFKIKQLQLRIFSSFHRGSENKEARKSESNTRIDGERLISNWKSEVIKDTKISKDFITSSTLQLLSLTLNRKNIISDLSATHVPPEGTPVPPNYHLAYFPPRVYESQLADDGYVTTHSPPSPFLRRMWAGGELSFNNQNPLRVGQIVNMETRCRDIKLKNGSQGESVFVWVDRDLSNENGWSMRDTRCLVYIKRCDKKQERRVIKVNKIAEFQKTIHPSSILLFRFSALTFNSHLIHFDHRYATEIEGYPGCLVHGPLTCTLLLDLIRDNLNERDAFIKSFSYRALSPLIVDHEFKVCGKKHDSKKEFYEVWAENAQGGNSLVMSSKSKTEPPVKEVQTTVETFENPDAQFTIIEHVTEETQEFETIIESEEIQPSKSETFTVTSIVEQPVITKDESTQVTQIPQTPTVPIILTPKLVDRISETFTNTSPPKNSEMSAANENLPTLQRDISPDSQITPQISPPKIQFLPLEKPERTRTIEPPPINAPNSSLSSKLSTEVKAQTPKDDKNVDIDEHLLPIEQVAERYKIILNMAKPSESRGLDANQAATLLIRNGPNILTPPKKKSAWTYLGAILILVAFLNAFIEFYQLQKSAAILESFLNMIPQKCMVIREGKLAQIQAADLVVGDVVLVRMGDKVPADLLMFATTDMKVDNSSLTGESDPQERTVHNSHKNPLEATNLCFNGTLAVSGEGYGIVIRTGDQTVLGQIAGLTDSEEKNKSPLSVEIDNFVKIIATIAITSAIVFFGIGMKVYDNQVSLTLSFAISVLVAWVPEGLPATVTVLLTIAAKRMASQNVLVKDLQGVETLGAITLLATDKTGTLTRNQMTVTYIWASQQFYTASQTNDPNNIFDKNAPGVQEILYISSLCSRVKFDSNDIPVKERQILGDATESGLTRFAINNIDDYDALIQAHPKVLEIPFNSETKWALSIHKKPHENGDLTLYIKGAPERILKLCSSVLENNTAIPLNDNHKEKYNEKYEFMASKGHRVLAFAQLLLPRSQYPENYVFKKEDKNYPLDGFCFVGLVSLEDPPKHGVREAIGRCRTAGIRVMMVTGDHPLTAEAIGRKINLMLSDTRELVAKHTGRSIDSIQDDEYNAIVIHGEQIDSLSDQDWDNIFSKNEIIFARTSPRHKLEIVKRAQSMGHIVGVTGDGVNDSPALKKADLGIAMNQSGSDVSKEAAAMILLDDNFASTVQGIAEGRLIFTNLKKSIRYTITHSTPQVMACLLYVLVPIPLPLPPILILVTDLGFELFLALSFAWDPPESDSYMKMPPRKPVTPTTVKRHRRIALQRAPTIIDQKTGERLKPSKFSVFLHNFKKPFTAQWWSDTFESKEGEVLVDRELLSWSYLEMGIIEAIGATLAYFVVLNHNHISPYDARTMQKSGTSYFKGNSPDYKLSSGRTITGKEQEEALGQAAAIVYLGIMMQQMFNLFAVKGRYRLPFGRFIFANYRNFAGIFLGGALGMAIVYIPPFNIPFNTDYHLSPLFWLIPLGFGVFILIYASLRLLVLRIGGSDDWSPEIPGLQMYPTVRSVERKA